MTTCERHPGKKTTHSCRICKDSCWEECVHQPTGICRGCLLKIGVVLFMIMVIASYTV